MDHLQKFISQIRNRLLMILTFNSMLVVAEWYAADYFIPDNDRLMYSTVGLAVLLTLASTGWLSARYLTQPIRAIWEAVLHISPAAANTVAPDLKRLHL